MRVLICGGRKSENIVNGIRDKLQSGGVEFLVVQFIDEIEQIYTRGDFFDRAVIVEQGWTRDGENLDLANIRNLLNNFSNVAEDKAGTFAKFVFLTGEKEMAAVVFEEIAAISNDSIIVVKQPKYTVNFFTSLVACDFVDFPKELVYQPEIILEKLEGMDEDTEEQIELTEEDVDLDSEFRGDEFEYEIEAPKSLEQELDELDEDEWDIDPDELGLNKERVGAENTEDNTYETEDSDELGAESVEDSETADYNEEETEDEEGDAELDDNAEEDSLEDESEEGEEPQAGQFEESYYAKKPKKIEEYGEVNYKDIFDAFASRGHSIAITGHEGSGKTTIAYNIANTLACMGYSVLLVDLDIKNRALGYITKTAYECVTPDYNGAIKAFNDISGIGGNTMVLKPGFHLLTTGLGIDFIDIGKYMEGMKPVRFASNSKSTYQYIVYDMPFEIATEKAGLLTMSCDNIVLMSDYSDWGIMKTFLGMCNIETDDMQDAMFNKAQLLYNKSIGLNKVMGKKISQASNIGKILDTKIMEMAGDLGYYFGAIPLTGVIPYDKRLRDRWFGKKQYTDTAEGANYFKEVIKAIITI